MRERRSLYAGTIPHRPGLGRYVGTVFSLGTLNIRWDVLVAPDPQLEAVSGEFSQYICAVRD